MVVTICEINFKNLDGNDIFLLLEEVEKRHNGDVDKTSHSSIYIYFIYLKEQRNNEFQNLISIGTKYSIIYLL